MNDTDHDRPAEQFPDVLRVLDRLAGAVDGQRYPGTAWPARRRRRIRTIALPAAALASAAALILLAIGLAWLMLQESPTRKASPQAEPAGAWQVPTGIDVSVAGSITLVIPTVSMPAADQVGGLQWTIPLIPMPTMEERSTNDEWQEGTMDPAGVVRDGQLACLRDIRPARTRA